MFLIFYRSILGASLFFALQVILRGDASSESPQQPHGPIVTDLRCEYLHEPLGIDVAKPRLSWIALSDQRDVIQSAYQIVVASSPDVLAQDKGDLWDSGKVQSDESAHVEYSGAPLQSREKCWWKIRTWEGSDQPAAWSKAAKGEMGLLKPVDWQAKWIEAPPLSSRSAGILSITSASYEDVAGTVTKDVTGIYDFSCQIR